MGVVPSPYRVTIRARAEGVKDAFGNATTTWASRHWWVRSIAPGAMADPANPNRDLGEVAYTIHADADSSPPGRLDEVEVGGEVFVVDGDPGNWTNGPWPNPVAGVVVELKRSEG